MSKLHEISCRDCGSSISLNEEWDRTPYDMRPQDRVLRRCLMCGGEMLFYKRWIDPPTTHPQCTDGQWSDEPCTMCFGPMVSSPEVENVLKFHDRCHDDYWYQKACDVCYEPMKVHVDWEDPPSRHRGCENEQWYEKGCKYCGSTLKVHVSWEHPPAAHRECDPAQIPDYTRPDNDVQIAAETNGHLPETELLPYQASDRRSSSNDASEPNELASTNGWHSNGYEAGGIDELVPACEEEITALSSESSSQFVEEPSAGNGYEADHFDMPVSTVEEYAIEHAYEDNAFEIVDETYSANDYEPIPFDLPIATFEDDDVAVQEDTVVDTVERSSYESSNEPSIPDFLIVNAPAFITGDDEVTADEYAMEKFYEELPTVEDLSEPDEPHAAQNDEELEASTPEVSDESSDPDRYCTRCGKQVGRTDAFQISNGDVRNEMDGICRECEHDAMLVNGAVAALRNKMDCDLNVASELRTVTRPITVVTNAETGDVIAEVILVDTGVFTSDRAAVAYDPCTDERFSKTVFGHKGLFSSLRTAETYDRDGHLLHHARHGGELALAADANDSDDRTMQVSPNRFFFKKR